MPLVLRGGLLVYATCSILRAENDAVVAKFLERHEEFSLQPAAELFGDEHAARVGDGRLVRLYPDVHGTDGFYAAALVRS